MRKYLSARHSKYVVEATLDIVHGREASPIIRGPAPSYEKGRLAGTSFEQTSFFLAAGDVLRELRVPATSLTRFPVIRVESSKRESYIMAKKRDTVIIR